MNLRILKRYAIGFFACRYLQLKEPLKRINGVCPNTMLCSKVSNLLLIAREYLTHQSKGNRFLLNLGIGVWSGALMQRHSIEMRSRKHLWCCCTMAFFAAIVNV